MICIVTPERIWHAALDQWQLGREGGKKKKNGLNGRRVQMCAVPTTRRLPEWLVALLPLCPRRLQCDSGMNGTSYVPPAQG